MRSEFCASQSGKAVKFQAHYCLVFLPFSDLRNITHRSAISSCEYNTKKCDPQHQPQTRFSRHPSNFSCDRRPAGATLLPCHCLTLFNITGVSRGPTTPLLWDPGLIRACHVLYGMFILSLMCNSCVNSV